MTDRAEEIPSESENPYKIHIEGRNLQVTDPMKIHIENKIAKIEAITPTVTEVKIFLEIQKEEHRAEILYNFSHFHIMTHGVMNDMYQAFDLATERLKKKLRKWKTKIQSHHAKKPSEVELSLSVLDRKFENLDEINDMIEEENFREIEEELQPATVVRKIKRKVPMLTVDEAAMRMDLMNNNFLVYRAEEDQKLKVMFVGEKNIMSVLEIE